MDSLERVFKAKGYDKTHPELYNRIIKFRDILNEKDIITEPTKSQNTKNNFGKYLAIGIGIFGLLFGLDWFLRKRLKQEPEQKKINA